MTVYRSCFDGVAAANGAAYATFNSPTRLSLVHEMQAFNLSSTTTAKIVLGKPANTPVATTTITPLGPTAQAAATARMGTAWSTAPTAPTSFMHGVPLAGVFGAGVVWKWAPDEYLQVAINEWLVWWNNGGATAGQPMLSVLYEE